MTRTLLVKAYHFIITVEFSSNMSEDEENHNEEAEVNQKLGNNNNLNRIVAILFVVGIYFLIFLKMLFLK